MPNGGSHLVPAYDLQAMTVHAQALEHDLEQANVAMRLALEALTVTANESANGTRTQAAIRAKAKRALRRALGELESEPKEAR